MMNSVCELKPAILLACGRAVSRPSRPLPLQRRRKSKPRGSRKSPRAAAKARWVLAGRSPTARRGRSSRRPGFRLRGAPGTKAVPEACAGAARRSVSRFLEDRQSQPLRTRAQRTLEPHRELHPGRMPGESRPTLCVRLTETIEALCAEKSGPIPRTTGSWDNFHGTDGGDRPAASALASGLGTADYVVG